MVHAIGGENVRDQTVGVILAPSYFHIVEHAPIVIVSIDVSELAIIVQIGSIIALH